MLKDDAKNWERAINKANAEANQKNQHKIGNIVDGFVPKSHSCLANRNMQIEENGRMAYAG